jgi:hypothetical protein
LTEEDREAESKKSLISLWQEAEEMSARFEDHKTTTNHVYFDRHGRVVVANVQQKQDEMSRFFGVEQQPTTAKYRLSNRAISDVGHRLDIPAKYLRKINDKIDDKTDDGKRNGRLLSHNLNHWPDVYRNGQAKKVLIRGRRDDNGDFTCRTIRSGAYGIIDNNEVLAIVRDHVGRTPYALVRPYLVDDYMWLKVVVSDTTNGNYAAGFVVRNGEVGNAGLSVFPFIQRHSCTN